MDEFPKHDSVFEVQRAFRQQIGVNGRRLTPQYNTIIDWVRKWRDVGSVQDRVCAHVEGVSTALGLDM